MIKRIHCRIFGSTNLHTTARSTYSHLHLIESQHGWKMTRNGQKDSAAACPNVPDDGRHVNNHDGASVPAESLPKRQKRGKYVSQAWFVLHSPISLGCAYELNMSH